MSCIREYVSGFQFGHHLLFCILPAAAIKLKIIISDIHVENICSLYKTHSVSEEEQFGSEKSCCLVERQ